MKRHSRSICRVLTSISPTTGVEVGVWQGTTSSGLLQVFPGLTLYMVDPWEKLVGIETMPKTKEELIKAHITALELTEFAKDRRVVIQEISEVAVELVKDESVDFVFIDGNHLYDFVKQDIGLWFPKVRRGGIISGHDYDGRGDRVCGWGVKRAVDEFIDGSGFKVMTAPHAVWWFQK